MRFSAHFALMLVAACGGPVPTATSTPTSSEPSPSDGGLPSLGDRPTVSPQDPAVKKMATDCEQGNARVCLKLGEKLNGTDRPRANTVFQRACDGGVPDGCTNLAKNRLEAGEEAKAVTLLVRGCREGSGTGCYDLARLEETGKATKKDLEAATSHDQAACTLGHAEGCYHLGASRLEGIGGKKDEAEAARLFTGACNDNRATFVAKACTDLALCYQQGRGVPKDEKEAARLFKKACDGGDPRGCENLGQKP